MLAVAVVLDVPERVCADRNASRPERQFGAHVLRNQQSQLRRSIRGLRREGFHRVFVLSGEPKRSKQPRSNVSLSGMTGATTRAHSTSSEMSMVVIPSLSNY